MGVFGSHGKRTVDRSKIGKLYSVEALRIIYLIAVNA
jgi:hypothetical protein